MVFFFYSKIQSGFFVSENTYNKYLESGQVVDGKVQGNQDRGEIIADITSSFVILLAIFFPSCTGIYSNNLLTYNTQMWKGELFANPNYCSATKIVLNYHMTNEISVLITLHIEIPQSP